MSYGYLAAGLLLACIVTGGFAYWRGYEHGKVTIEARAHAQVQAALTKQAKHHQQKRNQVAQETIKLRQQNNQLAAANRRATEALHEALDHHSDSCLRYQLPADVMQQLRAARDHATALATGANDGDLSATSDLKKGRSSERSSD